LECERADDCHRHHDRGTQEETLVANDRRERLLS
jgi:hypothetical protein